MRQKQEGFIRTTIYIPRDLYAQAKMMSVLTERPVSYIIRVALAEKIKELKESQRKERE